MSLFGAVDSPTLVMQKIRSTLSTGALHDLSSDPALIPKLRLVGVYDDRQDGYFMLRIRIPGGRLTWEQADAIGRLASDFANRPASESTDLPEHFVEITTRQDIQVHWIRLEDLGAIWGRFEAVGLLSLQACGDTARNVTGCPVSGLLASEVFDSTPHVETVNRLVLERPDLGTYLPRKFKIAVTGCVDDCVLSRINDLAFLPAERDGEIGFSAWIGGGLSDYPRLATRLDLFIPADRLADVTAAVITTYRDLGNFHDKAVNRFRRLVDDLGEQRADHEVRSRLATPLPPAGVERTVAPRFDHVGIHEQRQRDLVFAGLSVPVGRMGGAELVEIARLARHYGDGTVRLTPRQDLVIPGIQTSRLAELLQMPVIQRYSPSPKPFSRSVVACTSAPFCKFGILNVKQHGAEIAALLDAEFDGDPVSPMRLHLSGCKASCAQIQIADVGLRATMTKDESSYSEAFDVLVGGDLAAGRLGRWLELEVPAPAVRTGLVRLIHAYQDTRSTDETMAGFLDRQEPAVLRGYFTGVQVHG